MPDTEAIRTTVIRACQPNQAPKAASSLKSPWPIPSLPVIRRKAQYTVHKNR